MLILGACAAMSACGDSPSSDGPGSGKQAVKCNDLPSYMCDEYPEQCRPDENDVLFLGFECYGTRELPLVCGERSDCVEAEAFLQIGNDAFAFRGCINSLPSGVTVVSEPSEKMIAAAATPCDERLRLIDENCRAFSGGDCPVDELCVVDTLQVLDPERDCATGETYTECRGATIVQVDGVFEYLPCE